MDGWLAGWMDDPAWPGPTRKHSCAARACACCSYCTSSSCGRVGLSPPSAVGPSRASTAGGPVADGGPRWRAEQDCAFDGVEAGTEGARSRGAMAAPRDDVRPCETRGKRWTGGSPRHLGTSGSNHVGRDVCLWRACPLRGVFCAFWTATTTGWIGAHVLHRCATSSYVRTYGLVTKGRTWWWRRQRRRRPPVDGNGDGPWGHRTLMGAENEVSLSERVAWQECC